MVNSSSAKTSVCGVVVTYNPDSAIIENVRSVAAQVAEVIVVDNGSFENSRQVLTEVEAIGNVTVIYNRENLGIATALNSGVRYAREKNYSWLATFDQDSEASGGFIESLLAALNTCSFKEDVALIAPRYRDKETGILASYGGDCNGPPYVETDSIITSGNIVRMDVFDAVGVFDDELFIDAVDHDFCLRLRKKGFRILISCRTELGHRIGAMELHHILGRQYKSSNHPPLRRYYNARNRITIYKRYAATFPGWVLTDLCKWLREIAGIMLLEKDAAVKLTAIAKGVVHGFAGRSGKFS